MRFSTSLRDICFALATLTLTACAGSSTEIGLNTPSQGIELGNPGNSQDITAPSTPGHLRNAAGSPSASSVQLVWDESIDDVALAGYNIMRGSALVMVVADGITSFTDTSVASGTDYQYTVIAFDTAGNQASSNTFSVTTTVIVGGPVANPGNPQDITAPSAPSNLRNAAGSPSASSVQLVWNISTDNVALAGYNVMRGGTLVTVITDGTASFTDTSVTSGTAYQYTVIAFDAAGNQASSNTLSVNTTTSNATTGVATLSWTAPTQNTDNSSLTNLSGYTIYYGLSANKLTNSITINTAGLTTYVIENLTLNTEYFFSITAINSENSESAYATVISKRITG